MPEPERGAIASPSGEGSTSKQFTPQEVAKRGEEIYARDHRERLEAESTDQFVAIDVSSGQAYVAPQPEAALEAAREAAPDGVFHLIKIGSEGAFRVSYTSDAAHSDWLLR